MPKISIIIPSRNEEKNINRLLLALIPLKDKGFDYEAVVVDDSDDATPVVAESLGAKVIVGRRLGLAQAVLDGIDASKSDYIIVMDADLQHPPKLLPQIIEQLSRHDLVIVTKHAKETIAELSWWRKLQSNLGVWASQVLIPVPVSDPMTGFFGMRRQCLEGIPRGEYYKVDYEKAGKLGVVEPSNWDNMNTNEKGEWYHQNGVATKLIGLEAIGFKIGLELFTKAKWVSHGEIPMSFARREAGQSKGTAHSLHKHLIRLFSNSLNYEVELPKGSEEYFAFYEGTGWQKKWKQDIAKLLEEITSDINPQCLLDIGCGSSPNINYMVAQEKIGLDIDSKALDYMLDHSDAKYIHGSVLEILFPNDKFDVIACIEVLEHLYSDDVDRAMSEIARVLKPSGYAILATPNYSSILWNIIENAQKLIQHRAWTSDHHTKFSRKSLNELCQQYGLREVHYDSVMRNMDMVITFQKV